MRPPFTPERLFKGLAVPFTILWRAAAPAPDFTNLDPSRHVRALDRQLCGICGQQLNHEGVCVWIGGEVPADQWAKVAFVDAPMHEACAIYSTKACPFLAHGRRRLDTPADTTPDRGAYFMHYGRGVERIDKGHHRPREHLRSVRIELEVA